MCDPHGRGRQPCHVAAGTAVLALPPCLDAASALELCRQLTGLLHDPAVDRIVCDAAAVQHPDLGAVDAIARLHLSAVRHGRAISVVHAPPALQELLALAGMERLSAPAEQQPGRPAQPAQPGQPGQPAKSSG